MQTSPQWSQEICKNKMQQEASCDLAILRSHFLMEKDLFLETLDSSAVKILEHTNNESLHQTWTSIQFWCSGELVGFFLASSSSLSAMSFESLKIFLFLCSTCCEDSTKAHAMAQLPPIFLSRCSGDLQWLGCIMFYVRAFWRFCCPTFSKTWSNTFFSIPTGRSIMMNERSTHS